MALARIAVLISGRGSNLDALTSACARGAIDGAVTTVISNRADAAGIARAHDAGIATSIVDHRAHGTREAFDDALTAAIARAEPDLVVLAGFMRVLGEAFVRAHEGRLVNIHPSLLPLYPGLHTHRRALADGVKLHGCSAHFVTATVDGGPLIAQGAVPVLPDDDEATLAARVLAVEHQLLPGVVGALCRGDVTLVDGRVRWHDAPADPRASLLSPPLTRT